MSQGNQKRARWGMVIDLDRCTGCGSCTVACAVENNISVPPPQAGERKGIVWLRVETLTNGHGAPGARAAFLPIACQQCGHEPPCVTVCPQNAVDIDPQTGIVSQIPQRCLGCRYCMAACPYHARSFTWWDPEWPQGQELLLNPEVTPRMRGVAEKCNFCHARLHAAKLKAAAEGRGHPRADEVVPACAEACPTHAIQFGDLDDGQTEVGRLAHGNRAFRLLEGLGTDPKVVYLSSREWVRRAGRAATPAGEGVEVHG
jgi:molybdopterin-containing oxidoreductase family iron-sulfur binding subunit